MIKYCTEYNLVILCYVVAQIINPSDKTGLAIIIYEEFKRIEDGNSN